MNFIAHPPFSLPVLIDSGTRLPLCEFRLPLLKERRGELILQPLAVSPQTVNPLPPICGGTTPSLSPLPHYLTQRLEMSFTACVFSPRHRLTVTLPSLSPSHSLPRSRRKSILQHPHTRKVAHFTFFLFLLFLFVEEEKKKKRHQNQFLASASVLQPRAFQSSGTLRPSGLCEASQCISIQVASFVSL